MLNILYRVVWWYPVERETEMADGVHGIGKGVGAKVDIESRKTWLQ